MNRVSIALMAAAAADADDIGAAVSSPPSPLVSTVKLPELAQVRLRTRDEACFWRRFRQTESAI